jgi:hypothetical protein
MFTIIFGIGYEFCLNISENVFSKGYSIKVFLKDFGEDFFGDFFDGPKLFLIILIILIILNNL